MRVQSVESAEDGNGFTAMTAGYLSQKAGVGIKYFERHVASKSTSHLFPSQTDQLILYSLYAPFSVSSLHYPYNNVELTRRNLRTGGH